MMRIHSQRMCLPQQHADDAHVCGATVGAKNPHDVLCAEQCSGVLCCAVT
jgi:hypothetical protein